jgi:hypothetical protein
VVAPVGLRSRLLGFVTARILGGGGGRRAVRASSTRSRRRRCPALAAGRFGGVPRRRSVARLFVLGMLVVDGINGV